MNDKTNIKFIPEYGFKFPIKLLFITISITLLIYILSCCIGSVYISPITLLKILLNQAPIFNFEINWPQSHETILLNLRLPRVTLAAIVGAGLAFSGTIYQGLFKNPLADPYLIGAASGAALGATIIMSLPWINQINPNILPVAAFIGAMLAVLISYFIARNSIGLNLATLILSGVAISTLFGATTTLLMIQSNPDVRPVLSWLMGSFISSQWIHCLIASCYLIPCMIIAIIYSKILNIIQLHDNHAKTLGVDLEKVKLIMIITATLTTAACVSFVGLVGFVGLICPHAIRLMWSKDYRILVPTAAIVGAGFLILSDTTARTIVENTELPIGIITAFCGVPFFIFLLIKQRWRIN